MALIEGKYLASLFVQEAPTGAIDGVNVTFNLGFVPAVGAAVNLFLDGVKLRTPFHYSIAGQVITMVDAPILGQDLEANYIKA